MSSSTSTSSSSEAAIAKPNLESKKAKLLSKLKTFQDEEYAPWLKTRKGSAKDWRYTVAGDLGATNFRVSVQLFNDAIKEDKYMNVVRFKCTCTNVLAQMTHVVAGELVKLFGKNAEAGVLAVAGPVSPDGKQVCVTNYTGAKDISVEQLPSSLFPFEHSRFLNDLEAGCYGILTTGLDGKLDNYFVKAFDGSASSQPITLQNHHYAVLAMGTGLGCGLVFSTTYKDAKCTNNPTFDVIPLEAAHVNVAYPNRHTADITKEINRIDHIGKNVYNSQHAIEIEDICSGRGLAACYEFETNGKHESPTQIAKKAATEKEAGDAMLVHYRYLMKAAQAICIMIPSCKGVFLVGDNQVHNKDFFSEKAQKLQEEFLYHPKQSWLEKVTVLRQIQSLNMNLRGAFYYARKYLVAAEPATTKAPAGSSSLVPLVSFAALTLLAIVGKRFLA